MAGVKTTHPAYDRMLPQWQKCSDVVAGQRAVHMGGEKYLPKNGAEEDAEFRSRIARSDFFNASWRTIAGLAGMAFRKDPTIEVPAAIEPMLADIDLAGKTIYALAKDLTEDVLEQGRMGLLVDHPPMGATPISQAVAERNGIRPAVKVYDAKCITNWRYEKRGNATVLAMVTMTEEARTRKDEFEDVVETHYRVLDLDDAGFYRQRVFAVRDGADVVIEGPIYPVRRGAKLAYIPFRIVGVNGMGGEVEEPPLIDLADANIAHYQVNSDIRVAMHFGVPTFVISGLRQEPGAAPIMVGSHTAILLDDPQAKAYFAEPNGYMLPEMRAALKEIEQRMAILGARMIADETRQAETLGATQIKRASENSVMASAVIAISEAVQWALAEMADWVGASGECKFEISREFNPLGLPAQELSAIFAGVQQGIISEQEAFTLLQRADLIDGEKTFDEHQEEVGQTSLPAPVAPANDLAA